MQFKRNFQTLVNFKQEMAKYAYLESSDIMPILNWVKARQKKIKTISKIINLNECKGWHLDKKNNLYHESKQFFKVKGVETKGAFGREVNSWTQPILTQKHGGVLAFISRQTNKFGTQFLIDAKIEPGDDSIIKISPSFQATQSNMNRAHGGKRPHFYDIVMQKKGAELIYYTIHNEEGARFWRKSNWNVIVKLKNPFDKRVKGSNYKWVSLKQLKKLALRNRCVNPFVKTILFML
jgi:oxidase EvaA|tara:strand:- start:261 stop:968 length:708 start_codon:yes stop_codon:yes gene_type:complete